MLASGPLGDAQAEKICRRYFYAGFAGLPFLWFATWLFFRHHARDNPAIEWYVVNSLRLSLTGGLLLLAWYVVAILFLPPTSALFVIPPCSGSWCPGAFVIVDD
ncbi:hypothetical protein TRVL_01192 [Trypanosoma vivax]|nr:hypothetical protein TRVL_01192 [Trypanosoma vivax]